MKKCRKLKHNQMFTSLRVCACPEFIMLSLESFRVECHVSTYFDSGETMSVRAGVRTAGSSVPTNEPNDAEASLHLDGPVSDVCYE